MAALLERVFRGTRWAGLSQALRQALHLGTWVAAARLTDPSVLGQWAALMAVVTAVRGLAEAGLGGALVQRTRLGAADADSVFWASTALGCVLAAAFAAVAGPAARLLGAPALAPWLGLASLGLVTGGLAQTPQALLQRDLDFRRLAPGEIGQQLVWSGVALAGLARGHGVGALVAAQLAGEAVNLAALFLLSGYRPRLRLDRAALRHAAGFGGRVALLRIVNTLAGRLDAVLIARLAGLHALGLYGMATQMLRIPEQHVSQLLRRVLFPAFAALQHERARLAEAYLRLVASVALVTFPLCAGVVLVFEDFVAVALGPAWADTAPLVPPLALAGALFSVGGTIGTASWALGRPHVDLRLALLRLVAMTALLALAAPHGPRAVAWATAAYAVGTWPVYAEAVRRLLGVGPGRLLRALWPALSATGAMAALVLALRAGLADAGLGALVRLAAAVALGTTAYGALLVLRREPLLRDLRALLLRRPVGAPL